MERFHFKQQLKLGYIMQGYIFFTCQNYRRLPQEYQKKIESLCEVAGGEYKDALLEVMTTRRTILCVARRHHMGERTLRNKTEKFYERIEEQGF